MLSVLPREFGFIKPLGHILFKEKGSGTSTEAPAIYFYDFSIFMWLLPMLPLVLFLKAGQPFMLLICGI